MNTDFDPSPGVLPPVDRAQSASAVSIHSTTAIAEPERSGAAKGER
jgi:hypothetical protein